MSVNIFRNSSSSSSVHVKEQINSSSIMSPSSCLDTRLHKHKLHAITRYSSEESSHPRTATSRSDCACNQSNLECPTKECRLNCHQPGPGGVQRHQQRILDYGTMTPSSSSSTATGNTTNRVNIIRNRFFSDGTGDFPESFSSSSYHNHQPNSVGQYGYENDHSEGCEKRWIRMRSSKSECFRCSTDDCRRAARRKGCSSPGEMGEEEEEEGAQDGQLGENGLAGEEDEHRQHVKGGQRWRNVKAVMAYYYALRKIKRNVAFVSEDYPIKLSVSFGGCCVLEIDV